MRRRGVTAAALSVAAHLGLLAILLAVRPQPAAMAEPQPIQVTMVAPPPVEVPLPPAPAPPTPQRPPPPHNLARPTPPRADIPPRPARLAPVEAAAPQLSDAQLAAAAPAGVGVGSGRGGRSCDMARRLQVALRKDARVQAAVADARAAGAGGGKALFVWNGDWIRSHGQDGNGLAAVREAIMWEVGFAPEACRSEPVHGLVLFSLNDGPGGAGLVLGAGDWRWSDLLRPRAGG